MSEPQIVASFEHLHESPTVRALIEAALENARSLISTLPPPDPDNIPIATDGGPNYATKGLGFRFGSALQEFDESEDY